MQTLILDINLEIVFAGFYFNPTNFVKIAFITGVSKIRYGFWSTYTDFTGALGVTPGDSLQFPL